MPATLHCLEALTECVVRPGPPLFFGDEFYFVSSSSFFPSTLVVVKFCKGSLSVVFGRVGEGEGGGDNVGRRGGWGGGGSAVSVVNLVIPIH